MILPVIAAALAVQDPDLVQLLDRADQLAPAPGVFDIRPLILERLQADAQRQQGCIPDGVAVEAPQSVSATRFVVQAIRSRQARNAWTVYGQAIGCPGAARIRFLVVRMADDTLRIGIVNVGESLANPSLLQEAAERAAPAVAAAVRGAVSGCAGTGIELAGTQVVERGADLSEAWHGTYFRGSWREAWTFALCGRRVAVPIAFVADGLGGAGIDVGAGEVRMVE